jgi:hypothetical protein
MVVNKILLPKVKVRFSVLLSELLGDTIEIKLHCQHIHQAFVCDKRESTARHVISELEHIASNKLHQEKHDTSYDRGSG